jgi:large subunit ribosomal protein L9
MEVLLLDDINGVGKRNDLVVVKDGFALNNLLPLRRALVATPTVRKRYAEHIRHRAEERANEKKFQEGTVAALATVNVHFTRKITKTGKLYAAISQKIISDALKKEHSLDVPPDAIVVTEPIKTLGTFNVEITLGTTKQIVRVTVEKE